MLQKPHISHRALLHYALILPLAALLTLCTQEHELPLTKTKTPKAPVKVEGEVFDVVEEQPEFPGGMAKLGAYLAQNLKYPLEAQKANVSGRVFLNFIITKTGQITDVKVLKGIGCGADEEAARVVSLMPDWIPGKQNGQAVNVRYNLPINFQLE